MKTKIQKASIKYPNCKERDNSFRLVREIIENKILTLADAKLLVSMFVGNISSYGSNLSYEDMLKFKLDKIINVVYNTKDRVRLLNIHKSRKLKKGVLIKVYPLGEMDYPCGFCDILDENCHHVCCIIALNDIGLREEIKVRNIKNERIYWDEDGFPDIYINSKKIGWKEIKKGVKLLENDSHNRFKYILIKENIFVRKLYKSIEKKLKKARTKICSYCGKKVNKLVLLDNDYDGNHFGCLKCQKSINDSLHKRMTHAKKIFNG